jgi:hypothetical protein
MPLIPAVTDGKEAVTQGNSLTENRAMTPTTYQRGLALLLPAYRM